MSTLKSINNFRRKLTRILTKNIGKSHFKGNIDSTTKVDIKKILISRPNHRLGNLLLMTPLLQELIKTFPDCKIDLFVKGGLAPILFENYDNIDKVILLPRKPFKNLLKYLNGWISIKKRSYDLVINVDKNSSSGRLSTQYSRSKYKIFGDLNEDVKLRFKDHKHIAKCPVYNLRDYLTNLGYSKNDNHVDTLDLKLNTSEIENGKKILDSIVPNSKKTICIFTFATGDKCYSKSWWGNLYNRLLIEYPNYNIMEVLPVENVSQIDFKAPTYYSKELREIGSVFANTEIFIGADSGMMHLSSASLLPTVGFFSVTNEDIYRPYGNNSVSINTNNDDTEDCIKTINDCIKAINKILISN